jgi:hypothetical protein
LRLPKDVYKRRVHLAVSDTTITPRIEKGWLAFKVDSILDHELALIE